MSFHLQLQSSPINDNQSISPRREHAFTARSVRRISRPRPTSNEFLSIQQTVNDFVKKCFINQTNQQFIVQLHRFEKAYDIFSHQLQLNVWNSHDTSNTVSSSRSFRSSSAIYKFSQTLITEWSDFVSQFSAVTDDGLIPHFHILGTKFEEMKQQIANLSALSRNTKLSLIKRCDSLRKICLDFYYRAQSGRNLLFDSNDFYQQVESLFTQISKISISNLSTSMRTGVLMRDKMAINIAQREIQTMVEGIFAFEDYTIQIRDQIFNFNRSLSTLIRQLQLPFSIDIKITSNDYTDFREELSQQPMAQTTRF